MEAKHASLAVALVLMSFCASLCAGFDTQLCTGPLESLLDCLPYAQSKSPAPSPTCCTNLGQVYKTQPKCLCELIAAGSEGGVSGLPPFNQTLALNLPVACSVSADPNRCPGLLGISPSSPEAQIFETPATSTSTTTGTTEGPAPSAGGEMAPKESGATVGVPANFPLVIGALLITFAMYIMWH